MNPLHPLLAFSLLLPLCRHSMASDAAPTAIPAPKPEDPRQAIEQFLGLTAIWMLEMEWTHAYANKTPKAEDFRNAMLAAGLQQCPRGLSGSMAAANGQAGPQLCGSSGQRKKKTATIITVTVTVCLCAWCSSSIPCRVTRKLRRAEIP